VQKTGLKGKIEEEWISISKKKKRGVSIPREDTGRRGDQQKEPNPKKKKNKNKKKKKKKKKKKGFSFGFHRKGRTITNTAQAVR